MTIVGDRVKIGMIFKQYSVIGFGESKFYDPMAENKVLSKMLEALQGIAQEQGMGTIKILSQDWLIKDY